MPRAQRGSHINITVMNNTVQQKGSRMRGKKAKQIRRMVYGGQTAVTPKQRTYTTQNIGTRPTGFIQDKESGEIYTFWSAIRAGLDPSSMEIVYGNKPVKADRFRNVYQTIKREYTRGEFELYN